MVNYVNLSRWKHAPCVRIFKSKTKKISFNFFFINLFARVKLCLFTEVAKYPFRDLLHTNNLHNRIFIKHLIADLQINN